MKLINSLRNLAMAALLLSTGVANAALYQFELTGDYRASFQLDSDPTPSEVFDPGVFALYDVEGQFQDATTTFADLLFYDATRGGGLEIQDFFNNQMTLFLADGSQLFTGTIEDPTFRLGEFTLTQFGGIGIYLLTVTEVDLPPGQVPEPASALLLLGGLGLLAAARRRARAV